ncbi:MAG: hypothetical protein K2X03_04685 [Bryobacteraceae bacterium]|nr:hypothetical protein [Bryobacteraceae bacterium]
MIILADARRRITLPASIQPNQPLDLIAEPDGSFRLVPMSTIPQHQAWAWTEDMRKRIAESLAEVHAGRTIALKSKAGKEFLAQLDKP